MNSPNMRARFKPRSDEYVLHQLLEKAWQNRYESKFPADVLRDVGERIARHIESRYHADDMAVLERYGVASELSEVIVSIYDGERWGERASIELPRPVKAPCDRRNYYSGGYHDPKRDDHLPPSLAPFFASIIEERKKYGENGRAVEKCIMEYRKQCGKYPTWQEIVDSEPVLAQYLAERDEAA